MYFRYNKEEKQFKVFPHEVVDEECCMKPLAAVLRHGDVCRFDGRCIEDIKQGKGDGAPIFFPDHFKHRLGRKSIHFSPSGMFIENSDQPTRQAVIDFFAANPSGETNYLWPEEDEQGFTVLVFGHI